MNCPHCNKPIDHALIRQAVNKSAASGKGSRPGAKGLVRNPKGRKPTCEHCRGTRLINGQQCGWCNNKRLA